MGTTTSTFEEVQEKIASLLEEKYDDPKGGKVSNAQMSTPSQIRKFSEYIDASNVELRVFCENVFIHEELPANIDWVFEKKTIDKNEISTTGMNLIDKGVAISSGGGSQKTLLDNFNTVFKKAINCGKYDEKPFEYKYNPIAFDQSRNRQQINNLELVVIMLEKTGILTDSLKTTISTYLNCEEAACVSSLVLDTRNHEDESRGIQKLHHDHFLKARGEIVLAIDLGGHPLKTRYYMRSHRSMSHFENSSHTDITNNTRNLKQAYPEFTIENGQEFCSASRLQVYLAKYEKEHALEEIRKEKEHADNLEKYGKEHADALKVKQLGTHVRYVEANGPILLFDAGGFHSGNAVFTTGNRLFLTFRSKAFRSDWKQYVKHNKFGSEDNWYPQKPVLLKRPAPIASANTSFENKRGKNKRGREKDTVSEKAKKAKNAIHAQDEARPTEELPAQEEKQMHKGARWRQINTSGRTETRPAERSSRKRLASGDVLQGGASTQDLHRETRSTAKKTRGDTGRETRSTAKKTRGDTGRETRSTAKKTRGDTGRETRSTAKKTGHVAGHVQSK